LDDACIRPV